MQSLILTTGGYTRVYAVSSLRIFENYGEGIALAYQAGVNLVDVCEWYGSSYWNGLARECSISRC
jgi:aspartate oxidase